MRKYGKKLFVLLTATAMTASVASLAACDTPFTPLAGDVTGEVSSNGGFVVEKGDYVYFINGVETYTSDNTYGDVVKGALMRIAKEDIAEGENTAETVVPSLMVAADYTSGLYVYGDRIYYATPNNVKNTEGVVENEYLDFKSAKLDGSDVKSMFRVENNATVYRFVEVDDVVYNLYVEGSTLYSYNTSTEVTTTLVKNMASYVLDSTDKENPYVYYTMNVVDGDDKDSPNQLRYTQIYRVSADATEAPYEYTYDQAYLDEHDGEAPYHNYGEIILDGIGKTGIKTQYTQHTEDASADAIPTIGYTYSLLSYNNDGIYFTRKDLAAAGTTTGETGWLYYLAEETVTETWNSVTGNADSNLDVVAQDTAKASASAVFYLDGDTHHYIYVDGANIYRADVGANGVATEQRIATNVSGATLMYLDSTSDDTYKYVYFNRSEGSGVSVERAVYNGTADDYSNLAVKDEFQPVRVLKAEHANSWYPYEIVDNTLFYADAEALGSTSYNYVSAVSLKNADGDLMNNAEVKAFNEKYTEVTDYINDLKADHATRATAINSYFYTGSTEFFEDNLQEAKDAGKDDEYLYNEEDKDAVFAYAEGKEGDADLAFKDYRVRSAFILTLGKVNESDETAIAEHWHGAMQRYVAPEETDEGLPVWAWILIGVGAALVVATAIVVPVLLTKAKKAAQAATVKKPKLVVDTTDDKSVDVYADETAEVAAEETATEAGEEAVAEESVETEEKE